MEGKRATIRSLSGGGRGDLPEVAGLDWLTIVTLMLVSVVVSLPAFMVGTLAVEIRDDLSFSNVALGGLISIYSGLTAIVALPASRFIERLGYGRGLVLAPLLAGSALLGSAFLADRWWHLAVGQVVAAASAAVAIPSVQLALASRVPSEQQGIAFGLNLSAIPGAILIAGVSVPLVGETVGWRWAYGGVGAFSLGVTLATSIVYARERKKPIHWSRAPIQRRLVLLGSGAMFLGVWSGQTVATFAVESGVAEGHSPGSIGYALGIASLISIGVRILSGRGVDRTGPIGAFVMIVWFILIGGFGMALLAIGGSFVVVGVGIVFGLGFGWGWNGLLTYGLVHPNPRAAATTAGFMMVGGFSGSALGPVVSGVIVSTAGFRTAWAVSVVAMVGAAILATLAGRDPRLSVIH